MKDGGGSVSGKAESNAPPDAGPALRAFLYDADGQDREVELAEPCLRELGERSLLWVDVGSRDPAELSRLTALFGLDPSSVRKLLGAGDDLYLDNYGEYFQFDVIALGPATNQSGKAAPAERPQVHLEFLVGRRFVVTVHEGELPFLQAFRDQDKGETLIGALSPPALVASLLDWHLTNYFESIGELEGFIDRVDEAMLARSAKQSLLAGVVEVRRRISRLRRLLVLQRPVFYGLSRPDFAHVVESSAAAHYGSLERRFERAVDAVDHARDLVQGSLELFTTRTAESTNELVRRLTFLTMLLGAIGAVAGVFGMNFETSITETGPVGFWSVLGALLAFVLAAVLVGWRRGWI